MTTDTPRLPSRNDDLESRLEIVKVAPSKPEPQMQPSAVPQIHSYDEIERKRATVQTVAEEKVGRIVHEHDPRQQIHPIFFVLGVLCAAVGLWLMFNDPVLFGERRQIPGQTSVDDERTQLAAAQRIERERAAAQAALTPTPLPRVREAAPASGAMAAPAPASALAPSRPAASPLPSQFPPGFLDDLGRSAQAAGVSRPTIDRVMMSIGKPDLSIVDLNLNQPEHTKSAGDYIAQRISAERLDLGRRRLAEHAGLLSLMERRYGVDRHVLMAIWGIESNYGADMGSLPVVRSLATLAANDTRRPQMWRDEFVAALGLIDKGDVAAERLVGSWAGAMGHMQFMPSSFQRHAVDFEGDGKRDLWASPGDALASAANYLKASGWTAGRAWGREVTLPPNFDLMLASPQVGKTVTGWQMLGVKPVNGLMPMDEDPTWQVILPAGAKGPAFLVSSNFEVLLKYNRAMPYALAVGHLADRLAGSGPIQTAWPLDDVGLSKDEISELQKALAGVGHDPGPIDGIIGAQTRAAIRGFQQARQLPPDGHASLGLLRRLRTERRI